MENRLTNGSETPRLREKFVISEWTPDQVVAAALAANEAGYDVDYESLEDGRTAMVLRGEGDHMEFTSNMMRILVAQNESAEKVK